MKLDPVSLRLFVAVMETGASARAAEREHIAPSAASRRLAELEARLKVGLFERSNRGIEPTHAAYALLHLARGVLNDLDGIAAQMRRPVQPRSPECHRFRQPHRHSPAVAIRLACLILGHNPDAGTNDQNATSGRLNVIDINRIVALPRPTN